MGTPEGKSKVESEKFSYFMESAMIEYYVQRNCSLRMVGGLLDDKGYAIALPKGNYCSMQMLSVKL